MARYTVQTATGAKRKAVYAKTRKEVSEKLTAAMADASKRITGDGGPQTVGAFLTSWLENSVRGSVRNSTYDRHESLCRVHLMRLLRRPKTQDSLLGRSRDAQGPSGPHLLCEPLFSQTLRAEGRARWIAGCEQKAGGRPEARREGHEALGG